MMEQYVVKHNQNIYDVAITLHGTIEGIYDLMISNPNLSFDTDLKQGDILQYHSYFVLNQTVVSGLQNDGILVANGERAVYPKECQHNLVLYCVVAPDKTNIALKVSGEQNMYIDWGDNTAIETLTLTSQPIHVSHWFNNVTEDRRIKIYGDFSLTSLDLSEFNAIIFATRTLIVDEFIGNPNMIALDSLRLFEGTYMLDLKGMTIRDLSPINDMSLQLLDLRNVKFTSISVLDDYLCNIVNNYGQRRDCEVYLSEYPSEIGMEAINTIINEPAWNESGKWKFVINQDIYTNEE